MPPVLERLPGVGLLSWGPPGPCTPLLPSSSPLLHPRLLFLPPGNHDVQVRQQLQTPNEASCLVCVPPVSALGIQHPGTPVPCGRDPGAAVMSLHLCSHCCSGWGRWHHAPAWGETLLGAGRSAGAWWGCSRADISVWHRRPQHPAQRLAGAGAVPKCSHCPQGRQPDTGQHGHRWAAALWGPGSFHPWLQCCCRRRCKRRCQGGGRMRPQGHPVLSTRCRRACTGITVPESWRGPNPAAAQLRATLLPG